MKTFHFSSGSHVALWIGLSFALFFAGCQTEDSDTTTPGGTKNKAYTLVATPTPNGGGGGSWSWEEQDNLSVFVVPTGKKEYGDNLLFKHDQGMVFKGYMSKLPGDINDWYVVYPHKEGMTAPCVTIDDTQVQLGNNSDSHLWGHPFPMYGMVAGVENGNEPHVQMNPASAVICLNVRNQTLHPLAVPKITMTVPEAIVGDFYVRFSEDAIEYTPASDNASYRTVTLNVENSTPIASDKYALFYLNVKPFTLKQGDIITFTVGDCERSLQWTKAPFSLGGYSSLSVLIKTYVDAITLNQTNIKLVKGTSSVLTATVKPDDAFDKTVVWSSLDESVATVDQSGKVTAKKAGNATIIAKADGKEARCAVQVDEISMSLDIQDTTLLVGSEATLTATVLPDYLTDKTVTWSTGDNSIVSVRNGVIKGLKAGKTTVTAAYGDLSATCNVMVLYDSPDGVSAKFYGVAVSLINGVTVKTVSFKMTNYSTESIKLVSVEVKGIGSTFNDSLDEVILPGSSNEIAFQLNKYTSGDFNVMARFTYSFKGETYTCETPYANIHL